MTQNLAPMQADLEAPPQVIDKNQFPIVGIGGSAGALAAFEAFFINMPVDLGVAYVIIQHLAPTSESMLTELISRNTQIPAVLVTHDLQVLPNHIYVIPPGMELIIVDGRLKLLKKNKPKALGLYCVDIFFKSLAVYSKEKAIGIVVSGMGTDGTLGIKALKEYNAMVMVQDPKNATYEGMPRSAISTGLPDFVLPVEEMPEQVIHYVTHNFRVKPIENNNPVKSKEMVLQKILNLILQRTGNDFSFYKTSTILRRIERRMVLLQMESIQEYAHFMEAHPKEATVLFQELLIGVTNFFRDPDTWAEIVQNALPKLLETKADNTLRIWVPACATGEEVYTWAMVVIEALETRGQRSEFKIQIFGTDIDQEAINKARIGFYSANVSEFVRADRLARFFIPKDDGYQIVKEIREMVVFAPQSLIKEAPFTKVDILSCRNFLIYIGAELQRKLLLLFHYALNPKGLLLLGSSESVGGIPELFTPVSLKCRIYARSAADAALTGIINFPLTFGKRHIPKKSAKDTLAPGTLKMIPGKVQKTLLDNYAPPSIVINQEGDLLYINGSAGKYLEILPGAPSLNIYKMAREGLKHEIENTVRQVIHSQQPAYKNDIPVVTDSSTLNINLNIRPFKDKEMNGLMLVSFEEPDKGLLDIDLTLDDNHITAVVEDLKRELKITKAQLQNTIHDMEASVEELTSTNEEVQSTNEELQSANEELTTSKEELQSLNEELITVNAELNAKMDEYLQVNNDIKNLLEATETCTIFLDNQLNIKRFSPLAKRIFKLIAGDVGRPITDIVSNIEHPHMIEDVQQVLETLIPIKKEIYTAQQDIFEMRVIPYRTLDNYIGGVLVTFSDITAYKQLQERMNNISMVEEVTNYITEALVILDRHHKIIFTNNAFATAFNLDNTHVIGESFYNISDKLFDLPELHSLLTIAVSENRENFNIVLRATKIGDRGDELKINGRVLQHLDNNSYRILLLISGKRIYK